MGKKPIPVKKIDPKTGQVLNTYQSINEAARDNLTASTCISKVTNGKAKSHLGYKWEIASELSLKTV